VAVDIEIQQAGTWPTYRLTLTRSGLPVPLAGATAYLIAESTFWQLEPGCEHRDLFGAERER